MDETSALIQAAKIGCLESVRYCLEKKVDPDKANQDGATALIIAAQNGHTETVRFLVDNRANVNQTKPDGTTALMFAAQNGHTETVRFLVNNGADVNQTTSDGATALMLAARNGHTEIVDILIRAGAHVNKADKYGWTALMLAAQNGYTKIVELLLEKGADPNAQSHRSDMTAMLTMLTGAICKESPNYDLIEILLKYNANPSIKDSYGKNLFSYFMEDDKKLSSFINAIPTANKAVLLMTLAHISKSELGDKEKKENREKLYKKITEEHPNRTVHILTRMASNKLTAGIALSILQNLKKEKHPELYPKPTTIFPAENQQPWNFQAIIDNLNKNPPKKEPKQEWKKGTIRKELEELEPEKPKPEKPTRWIRATSHKKPASGGLGLK